MYLLIVVVESAKYDQFYLSEMMQAWDVIMQI